jgi:hypothetical protein
MDEQERVFVWVLCSGAFFALLGGAFGAVAGALSWENGQAAGTRLGLAVARAFAQAAEQDFSPRKKGAIIGGADGFVFLGLAGTAIGAAAALSGRAEAKVLGPVALAAVLLIGGALAFGLLAYGLLHAGTWAVVSLFVGGMLGALLGVSLGDLDGLLIGTVAGVFLGTAAMLLCLRGGS